MEVQDMTRDQLVDEVAKLRRRVGELETETSEHKRAESTLKESEQKYRSLVENINVGIYRATPGTHGRYVEVNSAMVRIFGYETKDELLALDISGTYQNPEDRGKYSNKLTDKGLVLNEELNMKKKDGTPIIVSDTGVTVRDSKGEIEYFDGIVEDVTERKKAEEAKHRLEAQQLAVEALRKSEERFRLMAETSLDYIFQTKKDGTTVYCSPAIERILGYTPEGRKGTNFTSVIHPNSLSKAQELFQKVVKGETVQDIELDLVHKSGKTVPIEVSVVPISENGEVTGLFGIARDITERKRAEQALRESEVWFRSLIENSTSVYAVVDAQGKTLYESPSLEKVYGWKPEEIVGKGIFELVHHDDIEHATRSFGELLENPGVVKTVEVRYRHKDGSWRTIDVSGVNQLDNPAVRGIVLTSHDITERKKAEEALRKSKQRYRLLAENIRDVIWTMDMDLHYTYVSPSLERQRGYTVEEYADKNLRDVATPESYEMAMQALKEELDLEKLGHVPKNRFRLLVTEAKCKDGSTIWLEGEVSFLRDDNGKPVGILGVSRDITARKRAEEALRESEQRFRSLVETTSDWVWEVDQNGVYTYTSPKVKDLLGYGPEEVVGKTPFDFMPVGEAERVEKLFKAIAESREPFAGLQNTNLHKDGRHVELDTSGVPILDANGNLLGYRGIDRDITERRQAEETLRESEQKYRALVENINDIAYLIDAQGKLTYLGPQVRRYGIEPEEALTGGFWEFIHPEDRERLASDLERTLATGEEFPSEFRLIDKDGHIHWLEEHGKAYRDERGKITGISGMLRDITERKRAEEALRESEEKFRNLTEEITDGVAVTVDGKNYWVNKAFCDIFGYTKKELIGKGADFVIVPEEMPKLLKNMRDRLAGKDVPFHYESIAERKNGKRINISVTARRMFFENKKAILIVVRDITEQKQFARRLTEAHEEERRRLSGQLHDDLGQLLTVAKIRVDRLRDARFNDMAVLTKELSEVSSLLDSVLEKTRDLSQRLRPPLLDQIGLVAALRSLAAQFRSNTGTAIHIQAEEDCERVPEDRAVLIYRVAQEALTNVAKHAEATEVDISLTLDGEYAELSVADNGKGFKVSGLDGRTDCLGIRSMRSRVTDSGGSFRVSSEISRGTTLRARVPLQPLGD
jgi:PAS domain S-box-containing protein